MLEFNQVSLSDMGRIITGRTPPTKRPELLGNGVAFITPTDISEGSIFPSPERRLSKLGERELTRILLPPGAVCFTCIASIGKICLTREASVTNQQINSIVVDQDRFDSRWLFYALKARREDISQIASGSATPIINKTSFGRVTLAAPSHETQRRIARVLGVYDDLIEVNQRRAALLEDVARGLFEEWFVRFRFPGYEDVEFVETSEGPLPEAWTIRTIGQLGNVITGKTPSKERAYYFGVDVPFVKIPDMHGDIFILNTADMLSTAGASTQANKSVPAGSLFVSCIGTIGLVAISTLSCQTNQQINTVVPIDQKWTEYLFFSIVRLRQHLINLGSNGATMGNVNKQKFSRVNIVCPPDYLLEEYHRRTESIFGEICNLSKQNNVLTLSRDLLLPGLMSGQLSVAAERELEKAA